MSVTRETTFYLHGADKVPNSLLSGTGGEHIYRIIPKNGSLPACEPLPTGRHLLYVRFITN